MNICQVEACDKPIFGLKPYCRNHFDRWRRHGDPLGGRQPGRGCAIPGCDLPHRGLGWCRQHLGRYRRHGDPLGGNRSPGNRCEVEGCERWYRGNGYCALHGRRARITGDPMAGGLKDFEERFWSKVDRRGEDECWPWTGASDGKGYGRMHYNGKLVRTHRLSYFIEHGEMSDGLHVRHACDNPPCVNPAHLLPGSHADNMEDTVTRLRRPRKWTDDELQAICEDPRPVPIIAAAYGMSVPYAYVIRKHWRYGTSRSH